MVCHGGERRIGQGWSPSIVLNGMSADAKSCFNWAGVKRKSDDENENGGDPEKKVSSDWGMLVKTLERQTAQLASDLSFLSMIQMRGDKAPQTLIPPCRATRGAAVLITRCTGRAPRSEGRSGHGYKVLRCAGPARLRSA